MRYLTWCVTLLVLVSTSLATIPLSSSEKSVREKIREVCILFGEDEAEIYQTIKIESSGYVYAVAPILVFKNGRKWQESSRGLMGVKPETMEYLDRIYKPGFSKNLFDPVANVSWALLLRSHLQTRYLRYDAKKYAHVKKKLGLPSEVKLSKYLAIIAYNKGWGFVDSLLNKGRFPKSEYYTKVAVPKGKRVSISFDSYIPKKIKTKDLKTWQKKHDDLFNVHAVLVSKE